MFKYNRIRRNNDQRLERWLNLFTTLTAFLGDLGSVHSTHMALHNCLNSTSRGSDAVLLLTSVNFCTSVVYIHTQTHIHKNKIDNKHLKERDIINNNPPTPINSLVSVYKPVWYFWRWCGDVAQAGCELTTCLRDQALGSQAESSLDRMDGTRMSHSNVWMSPACQIWMSTAFYRSPPSISVIGTCNIPNHCI